MSSHRRLRFVAPLALSAVALGITACGPDQASEPVPSVVTVTETAAEPMQTETSAPVESDTSEPMTSEASEPTTSATQEDSVGPNDESGVVDVTVTGDRGIMALQHSGTVPVGDAGPTNQKLITGPGGCFALTNQGKPQLVVFPEDATFVLNEDCKGKEHHSCGKPSATIDGTEHFVGRQFSVSTVAVPKTSVAGIPNQCMQGSDDTILVVS